jgi:hypothetical protein
MVYSTNNCFKYVIHICFPCFDFFQNNDRSIELQEAKECNIKKQNGIIIIESPKINILTNRNIKIDNNSVIELEDTKSEESEKKLEDIKSEESEKKLEDIKSEEKEKKIEDTKSEEEEKKIEDTKSEEEEKEIKDKTNTRPETPIENEYEIIDGTQL